MTAWPVRAPRRVVRGGIVIAALTGSLLGTFTVPALADPFPPLTLATPYVSDLALQEGSIPGTYLGVLQGYQTIRDTRRDVLDQNFATVARINNTASPEQIAAAQRENTEDRLLSLSSAMGPAASRAFKDALAAGELPKVRALLGGEAARVSTPTATTLVEKQLFNNPRPFLVDGSTPAKIVRYNPPGMDIYTVLGANGSYPSGHTEGAYLKGLILASWMPQVATGLLERASDIGNGRQVLGVHYPLDIMGGRVMGEQVAAGRLNDPGFAALLDQGRDELYSVLSARLGRPLEQVLAEAKPGNLQVYRERLTYDFGRIDPNVPSVIPAEAAVLLRSAAPQLTDQQRLGILNDTAIAAGYPLDVPGTNGGWLRLDLAKAFSVAASLR